MTETPTPTPSRAMSAEEPTRMNAWNPSGPGCLLLRDWFAGQALTGILADSTLVVTPETIAAAAYRIADAMLDARQKAPEVG